MSRRIIHIILFFIVKLVTIIKGIEYNICRNGTAERSMSCDNIYIWGNQRKEFTNASNITLHRANIAYPFTELKGRTIRVIVHDMLPYINFSNYTGDLDGFLGNIWKIIESALGFKSNITSIDYDSGLDVIQRGEADVFLAAVVSKKGLKNIKYSQPYFYNWYHLYMKSPEARPKSTSHLETFNEGLWFASITMFCTLAISLWFVIQIINRNKNKSETNMSIFSCFLAVMSGFLNQGYDTHLKNISCRIIIIFSLFFGVLLYDAMNAVLVAKLATFEVKLPFESLDDLLEMKSYSLCVRSNSFVYNHFTFENKTVKPEWKSIVNGPGCLNINDQRNLARILCKDKLVILENRVVMGAVVRNYNVTCQLTHLRKKYFENANSFLMWQGFEPYRPITLRIRKLQDVGVTERLSNKYIKTELLYNHEAPKSPQVSIQHIAGIILLYCTAIVTSSLIMFVEILYENYVNNVKRMYAD